MPKLSIITAPDPRLKVLSAPVAEVDDGIRQLIDDMLETMYAAPGIGLAAVQVGVAKRVIVMDVSENSDQDGPLQMVNPEIVSTSDKKWTYEEGCLSLPDQYADVTRPSSATVQYLDYHGEPQTLETKGLLATCVQHEMDHLEGVLFVDHLTMLKRGIILKKLKKAKRQGAD